MGFLDKFKQEKDLDSGLDIPDTDSPLDDDGLPDEAPSADDDLTSPGGDPGDAGLSTSADMGGGEGGDDLHRDVRLVLEKLDTVKSQLQHVQSRLDRLEAEHGTKQRRS